MRHKVAGLFLSSILLAGCGGGGSSTPNPDQPPAATLPTLPAFSVASNLPSDGKTGVLRSDIPRVDFNTALDLSSITSTSIQLTGPLGNIISTTTTLNSASASLHPTLLNLPGNTKYTLDVASTITDINGRKLSVPFKSTFTTAAQSWDPKTTIIGTLPYLSSGTQPNIGADNAGNIIAVWKTTIAGVDNIFASRLSAKNSTWSPAATLYIGNSSGAFGGLSLAVGNNGDAYLVWKEYLSGRNSNIHAMRFNPIADSWSNWAEFNVSHLLPSEYDVNGTSVYSDTFGNLTFVSSSDQGLFVTRFDASKAAWAVPQRLDIPTGSVYLFGDDAIVDNNGDITVAWVQNLGLQVARYNFASNSWGAPHLLDERLNTSGTTKYFSMVLDNNRNLSIVWSRSGGVADRPKILAARFDLVSNKWSKEIQLDDGKSVFGATDASLVIDSIGNIIAVWSQNEGLFSAKYGLNNSLWSAPEKITPEGTYITSRAILSNSDIAGNFTVIFLSYANAMSSQYLASTGKWQLPVAIDTPTDGYVAFSNLPLMISDFSGNITVVWFAWNNILGNNQYVITANKFK